MQPNNVEGIESNRYEVIINDCKEILAKIKSKTRMVRINAPAGQNTGGSPMKSGDSPLESQLMALRNQLEEYLISLVD